MEKEIKNKVIVLTGGADGIGFNIAKKFANSGAKQIIILDINEERGEAAVNEINATYDCEKDAVFIKFDVAKDLDIFEDIIKKYNVNVLVNSAGIGERGNETSKVININLTAIVDLSLEFVKIVRKDRNGNGGTILNISSILGYRVTPYCPIYVASKFGLNGFSRSLGGNYNKTGVRVCAICPGFTRTSLTLHLQNLECDDEISKILTEYEWQSVDAVGDAAVDIFEEADSGTVWLVEGGRPAEKLKFD